LLQHDTAVLKMLFGIYVVVFNFVQTSTKNLASQRFFHIAVNLWKRYFCKRGRSGLHFELRALDCAN